MPRALAPSQNRPARSRISDALLAIVLVCSACLTFGTGPAAAAGSSGSAKVTPTTSATAGTPGTAKKTQATFGIGPANAKRLDGRPLLNYLASHGGRLTDHLALMNIDAKPVTLNLYVADTASGADGSIGYRAKADPRTDASWITLNTPGGRPMVTVAPRKTLIIGVKVAIPMNATPGDHAVGIIASLTSKINGKSGQRVDFEQRVALRTYIRVSGALLPQLKVENLHASYHGTLNPLDSGSVAVSYLLRNSGNVKLGGQQRVSVSGIFGKTGTITALADVPLLLPGSSVRVSATVAQVRPGFAMRAKLEVSQLQLPGDANPTAVQAGATTSLWAVPWTGLAGLFVVILLGLMAWWFLRRGRAGRPARHGNSQPIIRTPERVEA
jgi:hypothetical protein